jgi:hypothetical protein
MTATCQVCGLERATVRTQLRFQGEFVAVAACVDRTACRTRVEAASGTWDLGEFDPKRGPRGFSEAHRIVFEAARRWRERQANR